MKLLLAEALANLAPEVLPADDTKSIPWLNAVCARFFTVGKWVGTEIRWRGADTLVNFAVFNDPWGGRFFTLPRNIANILGASHGDPGNSLQARFSVDRIRGTWFEFQTGGWGVGDAMAGSGLQDAGDGYTCFRDITEPSYLRVKTEVAELTGAKIRFRGLDQNGEAIYTGTGTNRYEGVDLDISTGLITTTTQQFSAIPTTIQKPATYGVVRLYSVSVATATETLIGIYDPGDKAPSFRRYRIASTQPATIVQAMCKRRFIPALVDADEVIPGNLGAIELGFHGRRYDLQNDPPTAAKYWADAFALLNAELGEDSGGATPIVQFERGRSLGRIPAH